MNSPFQTGLIWRFFLVVLVLSPEFSFVESVHLYYETKSFNETVSGNVSKDNDNLWKYEYTRSNTTVSKALSKINSNLNKTSDKWLR